MAIKIKFDSANIPEKPTFVLAKRNGQKLGGIIGHGIHVSDVMNDISEISFKVYKYYNDKKMALWDDVVDFRLVWCKEWDMWFQIKVEIDEFNETIKTVYCTRLGIAELSQVMLYNIEINTENDIAREEYKEPTVFYKPEKPECSLLNRLTEKAKHYKIKYVSPSLKTIQRTFTFDDTSIYDAFKSISEEIGCLFVFESNSDETGKIQRTFSVYDLESNCTECGERGDFTDKCPKCGSDNIIQGYGNDTNIFVTNDELAANEIHFSTDIDSVKNCFKLVAGDDVMTAAIRNCNPNGSDYLWYFPDYYKQDMSTELVKKIQDYERMYDYYLNDYLSTIDEGKIIKYNKLVDKYSVNNEELEEITLPMKGFSSIINAFYNAVDLSVYLESGMMPTYKLADTTAKEQTNLLTNKTLSPVSVQDVSSISLATANSAVLSMAKAIVDNRYQVKVKSSSLDNRTWSGILTVTNYADEEDTADTSSLIVLLDDNYENFVRQKIDKLLNKGNNENVSITGLFKLDLDDFRIELTKYNLNSLSSFGDECQSCIDILIEQGIADRKTWANSDPDLYTELYVPYLNKLQAIQDEIKVREADINIITGEYDDSQGLEQEIIDEKNFIQDTLDFEGYLGEDLYLEFIAYRRESKFENQNYVSDGLNNAEIIEMANEFIGKAEKEIYKSAELQHSITASLNNLLVIDKFKPLVDNFEIGNWIRVRIDERVYKLRLITYEIDYDNLETLSVEFSDVIKIANGVTDQASIMKKATSMATTYDYVQKQASQGAKSNSILENWVQNGLSTTNTKIIGGADNQTQTWDNHGMLFRKYNDISDDYEDTQMKIINSTLAVTDDNWKTVKTAIGKYYYLNPETQKMEEAYGVNGELLIGDLILGKNLNIYNPDNTVKVNENGFSVSNGNNSFNVNSKDNENFITVSNGNKNLITVKPNGELTIDLSSADTQEQIQEASQSNRIDEVQVLYYVSSSKTELKDGEWTSESPTDIEDNTYIWTKTITKTSDGQTFETSPVCISANGTSGQDAILLRINSSRGTVFKNNQVGTVLTVVIYYGSKEITTSTDLKENFGSSAYLEWQWQRMDEETFGVISSTDSRLSDDGFTFTITPEDVDVKTVFKCNLMTD